MRKFSLKPKVERLDLEVDDEPVFVRNLSAGDSMALAEMQGAMAELAAKVRSKVDADDEEALGEAASRVLSSEQYQQFVRYQFEVVFLRWCDKDGVRKFTDRAQFDEVPAEIIQAIYLEASKADPSEGDAEGN